MIKRGDLAVVNTRAGLRMRRSPGGKQAYHKGRPLIRPYGWSARVTKIHTSKKHGRWARFGSYWMKAEFLREKRKPKRRGGKVPSPVPGYSISYAYGVRNSGYSAGYHTGNDYAAPSGARVVAVVSGRIVRSDGNGGAYGRWLQLLGDNGHVYMYAHLSRDRVRVGQRVKYGQVIGNVGTTGNSTGPHLHHEMSRGRYWSYGNVQRPDWPRKD